MSEIKRLYIVFAYDDPAEAPVLVTTENKDMAKEIMDDYSGVCYSYIIMNNNYIKGERREFNEL